jgi:pimeloyl-ACP methyl ester carboxylesterase
MAEGFECLTFTVPLDHFHDTGKTTEVTFAIKRHTAKGRGKGVFVTATGGPGTSGIQSAVSYTGSFAESVQRDYDIVFFDQRGAHLSGDLTCPDAAAAFYRSDSSPADSTATTGLGADAQAFVDDCLAESRADPSLLPYYGTRQAAEDLESFRQYLGADTIQLYGESYGTQLAQTYAAAHPEHIAGLFLDGPVDLSHSLMDYYQEQTKGFEEALEGTLLDCSTQEACTRDVAGANALTAWDDLAAQLAAGPVPFAFQSKSGTQELREFTSADLDNAASAYLYSESDRMLLQRAIAAASQGDLWYLSRLLYAGLVIDPETQQAIPDPSYSDGLYYAVECLDYGLPGATPTARATTYLKEGHDRGMETATLGGIFYGDLPCAYWPAQPADAARPPLLGDVPYPMFVLGATLDPATPWANAERIAANAGDNAYLIVKPGGPHVIFGRGEACPDDLVTAFLEDGTLPTSRRTVCPGDVADDYVPIPPLISTEYPSTKAALKSADDEIITSADYQAWDGEQPLATGCRFGGSIVYTPTEAGSDLTLDACSWSRGLGLTGTGFIDDDAGTISLKVSQSGADGATVRYRRDAKGRLHVKGQLAMFVNR